MNKKILVGLIAVAMSSAVFAVGIAADTAGDTQNVTVTVGEVALIDMGDEANADVTFTLTAPTEAGTNFTMPTTTSDSTYAITSNVEAGTNGTRAITAEIDAIDPAFVLTANVTAPTTGTPGGNVALAVDAVGSGAEVVTGITNVAQSGIAITYALTLASATVVPAHGDHTIAVTYTLGDD